jgi:hypothetical protein
MSFTKITMSDEVRKLITVLQQKGVMITTEDVYYIAGMISEDEWLGFDEEDIRGGKV